MSLAHVAGPAGIAFMFVGMAVGAGGSQAWNFIGAICVVVGFLLVLPGIIARW